MLNRSTVRSRRGDAAFIVILLLGGLLLLGLLAFLFLRPARVASSGAATATASAAAATASAPAVPTAVAEPETAAADSGSDRTTVRTESAAAPTEAAAPSAAEAGGSLFGRIVDGQGIAVPDAKVTLASTNVFEGLSAEVQSTDATGAFRFDAVDGRLWQLVIAAPGFAPTTQSDLAVPDGSDLDLGAVTIQRGALLIGRVVDPSGNGVAGAELRRVLDSAMAFGLMGREILGVTDGGGEFRIDQLASGPWSLAVTSDDHPPAVFSGDAPSVGVPVTDLVFELGPGASISGTVVGYDGQEPLAVMARSVDQRESPHSRSTEVDRDGSFELRGLRPGDRYRVQARERADVVDDDIAATFGVVTAWGQSRTDRVFARAGDAGVRLVYELPTTITFRAVDATSGEPIEDFEAWVEGDYRRDTAYSDQVDGPQFPGGIGRIDRTAPDFGDGRGEDTFVIEAVGYETYRRALEEAEEEGDVDFGDVALARVDVVAVRVLDRSTGEPVEWAQVDCSPWTPPAEPTEGIVRSFSLRVDSDGDDTTLDFGGDSRSSVTDEDGIARFNDFGDQQVAVVVEAEGYARLESNGHRLESGEEPLTLYLDEGGSVVVAVVDEEGQAVPGARVEHRPPNAGAGADFAIIGMGSSGEVADARGVVTFEHLAPGAHSFRIETGGSGAIGLGQVMVFQTPGAEADDSWTTVDVVAGKATDLQLVAPTLAQLSGVVLEDGEPLVGAEVSLASGDSAMPFALPGMAQNSTRTDAEGRFELPDLEFGEYDLTIAHPTRAMDHVEGVEVEDRVEEYRVDLPVTVVTGRVTGPDGEPVVGVPVEAEIVREPTNANRTAVATAGFSIAGADGTLMTLGGGSDGGPTVTDADGVYELRGVAHGRPILVKVDPEMGEVAETEPFEVDSGERREGVDLTVAPAGAIDVELIDGEGNPVGMTMVTASWKGGGSYPPEDAREFVMEGGRVSLSGLRPGPWNVSARGIGPAGSGPSAADDVEVEADQRAAVTLTLE